MTLLRPLLLLLLLCTPAWAILIVAGTPPSGTIGVVTTMSGTSTSTGSGAASGTSGTLQMSDGAGGFSGYAGSALCVYGITALSTTGTATCAAAPGIGVTSLTGTANQIAVSAATGDVTLSIPSSPTLPGITTGTFSGSLTGTASTATTASALVANGANCSAGSFPLGVSEQGAAESCTALPTSIAGTANQITASAATGAVVLAMATNPTIPGLSATQCTQTNSSGALVSIDCSAIIPSYFQADRPLTCTPNANLINVPDAGASGAVYQTCNDNGDGWTPIYTAAPGPTLMTIPQRPPVQNIVASFTAAQGTMFTFDTTAAPIEMTLPNAGDVAMPGLYRGIIIAGTNGVIVRSTPPNLINGVTTDYPTITGVHSMFEVERISNNAWILKESVIAAKMSLNLPMSGVKFPTSNPAELNNAQTVTRLIFDATTQECAIWQGHIGSNYYGNLQVVLDYKMTSATTGGVSVDVSVMATRLGVTADVNTESYDTANNCDAAAVPGTVGYPGQLTCILAFNDSLQADDFLKVKLCRAPADAGDTATGDMEVFGAALQYDGK